MTTTNDTETARRQYAEQLSDPRWLQLRQRILQRDGHTCRHCRSNTALQVHHRQYHVHSTSGIWKAPWQYKADLLITLCERCHETGHATYTIPVFRI